MKYAIVADAGLVPDLTTTTLFDLMGDPSLWMEAHEVVFVNINGSTPEWVKLIVDMNSAPLLSDFDTITADWVVLGPTEESLVVAATAQGARYLALDEGLVELVLEEGEEKEIPIAPDTATAEIEETVTEPVEVPALPKRRRTRAPADPDAPKRTRARKPAVAAVPDPEPEPEPMPDGAYQLLPEAAEPQITKAMIDEQYSELRPADSVPQPPSVVDHLKSLMHTLVENSDEQALWELLGAAARTRVGTFNSRI